MTGIYTLPPGKVVLGMILTGDIDQVITPSIAFDLMAYGADVEVTLPGPSPRELLCSCFPIERLPLSEELRAYGRCKGPTEWHDEGCLVRRLRLRLWPVGATWDAERKAWRVEHPDSDGHMGVLYRAHDVVKALGHSDCPAWVRVAFCEPE